jgi:two-component sensor histidine kinase
VLAVAQVHRRLYTSDDVQSVSVDQYLTALVEDLRRSAESNALAQLSLAAEPLNIEPDRAVAVGVIVNELVMNAFKYAYPGGKGAIRVAIKKGGDNRAILSVEDDGIGIAAQASGQKSTGLGQRIVKAMGEKLNAKIENDGNHKGTRVVLSFDVIRDKGHLGPTAA